MHSSHRGISELRFQDIRTGDRFDIDEQVMTREAMIAFASAYDPQPFHLDDRAAEASPVFERLSASGWHSALILQRLNSDFWARTKVHGLAGAGVDEIRWIMPVYVGDVLRCEMTVQMIRASASKPDRGIMTMRATAHKANGVVVTSLVITGVFAIA